MAVLKLDQTAAPDFRGVSLTLARAGLSMNRAFESAEGLLGSYQEGQQEKVDNEVFAEIAGMNGEQLQNYLTSNGLKGRNISKNLRDRIGKKPGVLASVAETLSGTGRAEAVEFRKEDAFTRTARAREADLRIKATTLNAQQEQFERGLNPTGAGVDIVPPAGTPGAAVKTPASTAIEAAATAPGGGAASVATALPKYTPSTPTETSFMGAVGLEVKNPYALAVIAATGQHESGFTERNAGRTWNDGKNDAGGIMSWNGTRLTNMQNFTQGDLSPEAQAAFFLQEDPTLIKRLEASTSLEEANDIMAKAWRFEGYKNTGSGSEYAGRLASAKAIYGDGPAPALAGGGPITATALDPIAVAAAEKPPIFATGRLRGSTEEQADEAVRRIQAEIAVTDPVTGFGGSAPLPATASPTVPVPEAAPPATPSPVAADTIAAAAPAPVATPAMDKFRAAVLADDTISTAQATKLFAEMDEFQEKGVAKRKAKRAEKVRGKIADMVMKSAADPKNLDKRAMVLATIKAAQEAGLTSEEVIQSAQFASDAADGSLKDVLIPKVTNNVVLDAAIAVANKAGRTRIESMPQHVLFKLATDFSQAESVTAGIVENLNLLDDGEVSSEYPFGLDWWGEDGKDLNILTQYIEDIAAEAKVTPAIAAAAMVKNFIRDPAFQNSVHRRFPKDTILEYLKNNMSAEAVARYQSTVLTETASTEELSGERLQLGIKQGNYNKMEPGPAKDALGAEIANLRNILLTGSTTEDGRIALRDYIGPKGMKVSDTLKRALETGDTESHKAGITNVVSTIMSDKNLSPAARMLLLSAMKM